MTAPVRFLPPLGLAAQTYLFFLVVVPFTRTLVFVPLLPCLGNCGPVPQLIAYTRLPGITPAEAEKMLEWGTRSPAASVIATATFPCLGCWRGHPVEWLLMRNGTGLNPRPGPDE